MHDFSDDQLMSPYAPMRVRNTYWWAYAREMAKTGWLLPDGRMDSRLPHRIMDELIAPTIAEFQKINPPGSEGREALGLMVAQAFSFRHWIPLAAQFEANGRQIFDFSDGLVGTLNHTDVKDATLEGLELPYPALYVRVGKQEHLKLEYEDKFEYMDGFFIAGSAWEDAGVRTHRLLFGLTTVLENGKGMGFPGYFLDIAPEMLALPCLEAVDAALARRRQMLAESGQREDFQAVQMARYDESAELLRKAMPLVLNCLFFLDSMGKDELPLEPGRDTSSELTVRWAQAPGPRRPKLASRLSSEGYALVHFVGKEFDGPADAAPRGHAAPGWVRGHWRMQPHGVGRTLRKRIRIPPVFRNPRGAPGDDVPGHVYVVGPETPQ